MKSNGACFHAKLMSLFVAVWLLGLAAAAEAGALTLTLDYPRDQDRVEGEIFVVGTVSDPSATVWVITHRMDTTQYVFSKRITVRGDGRWKVHVDGFKPGKLYELVVVANPASTFSPGFSLSYWPEAEASTEMIEVIGK